VDSFTACAEIESNASPSTSICCFAVAIFLLSFTRNAAMASPPWSLKVLSSSSQARNQVTKLGFGRFLGASHVFRREHWYQPALQSTYGASTSHTPQCSGPPRMLQPRRSTRVWSPLCWLTSSSRCPSWCGSGLPQTHRVWMGPTVTCPTIRYNIPDPAQIEREAQIDLPLLHRAILPP
jgi:hypothetical protein